MRRNWRQGPSQTNHMLENHSNVRSEGDRLYGSLSLFLGRNHFEATVRLPHRNIIANASTRQRCPAAKPSINSITQQSGIVNAHAPPMSGKDICPALSALTSRQVVPVNLVSAVGKSVT